MRMVIYIAVPAHKLLEKAKHFCPNFIDSFPKFDLIAFHGDDKYHTDFW